MLKGWSILLSKAIKDDDVKALWAQLVSGHPSLLGKRI